MIDLEMKSELLEGGTCVVSVAGELDMSTAPRFKQSLLGALGGLDTLFAIHPSRAAALAELISSWQDEAADRSEQKARGLHRLREGR